MAYIAVVSLGIAGCGFPDTASPSPSLPSAAASFQPRASSTPAGIATTVPTASPGPAAALFPEVSGWSLVDAPTVTRDFETAANSFVAGLGTARVLTGAEATRHQIGYVVHVFAFALVPDSGHTEMELFSAIVNGMRAGVGIEPVSIFGGKAVSLGMGEQEVILGTWTGEPPTLFLLSDGPSIGASREIYELLLEAGPVL